ncbi:MAG: copper resistance CopC/CopD family protein [Kiloniellaceae bacterium]
MRLLLLSFGLLALAWSGLLSSPAAAHAQLRATTPAAGSVLSQDPQEVRLTFSEPVAPLVLRWIAPDGSELALPGAPRADGTALILAVPASLSPGTHLISWRVASLDGHPVGGTFVFSIGAPTQRPPAGDLADTGASGWFAAGARYLLTVLLTLGVGGAVFATVVDKAAAAPGGTRHFTLAAAFAAVPAALMALGLHGADMLGQPPPSLFTAVPWVAAATSSFMATSILAVLAGIIAGISLCAGHRFAALAALALAALSYALSGHVATAPPRWLTIPAITLHAAAIVFWLGALVPLAGAAARRGAALGPLLRRFSGIAVPAVAILVLTGILLAVVQVATPQALLETAYGRLLLAKLAGVVGLLALAAVNRLSLTPAIKAGGSSQPLFRSISAEIVVALVVVGLASGFRLTPPPRLLATAVPAETYLHIHQERAMADVTLRPGRAGSNTVEIVLSKGDFSPLQPLEVEVAFAQPDGSIEAIAEQATPGAEGVWRVDALHLPFDGTWSVAVRVLISDFEQVMLTGEIAIPADGP